MSRNWFCGFCAMMALVTAALAQTPRYKVGRVATADEIRKRDISVAPDGSGLPVGHGTVTQGRGVYGMLCASCHGDQAQGVGPYPALAGGKGTLASTNPVLTVGSYWPYATTVWDYIRRTMPYQKPGSLTVDDAYSVTAFILFMNGIVDEKTDLNERNLAQVKMPNRDGFIPDPRPDIPASKNHKQRSKPTS
ncbi:MAG TPA: cytochrome c [Candidatus Acidoferrum sp.]